jgi:hypothetical protein
LLISPGCPGLERGADGTRELSQRHQRHKPLIEIFSRCAQIAFRNTQASEEVLNFRAPKQASQHERINALVCPLGSHAPKLHSLGRASLSDHHTPPIGHHGYGRRKMLGINNQERFVDDLAISSHLPWQPLQGVGLSLDLDASDVAVDYGDIDPTTAMIEAKFVDDQGVGTRLGVRKQPPISGLPDITVSKRFRSHLKSIAVKLADLQRPI